MNVVTVDFNLCREYLRTKQTHFSRRLPFPRGQFMSVVIFAQTILAWCIFMINSQMEIEFATRCEFLRD